MSKKMTHTASITNQPAWMIGGSASRLGKPPSAIRAIQIRANGQGPNARTIFRVNQLAGGVGRRTGEFTPTADGVNLTRSLTHRGYTIVSTLTSLECALGSFAPTGSCGSCNNNNVCKWLTQAFIYKTAPNQYHFHASPAVCAALNSNLALAEPDPGPVLVTGMSVTLLGSFFRPGHPPQAELVWGFPGPVAAWGLWKLHGTNPTGIIP